MKAERQLGPVIGATLVTKDLAQAIDAYQQSLQFSVVEKSTVSAQQASLWQAPKLIDAPIAILASSDGCGWLRIVEYQEAKPITPLKHYGWMSLETNVACVDSIRAQLNEQHFSVIGEPAYLQVSDAIKAMQVIGPANEVSYLTQVEKPVPPFELPQTTAFTSSLFIPVLMTPSRQQSAEFYQALHQADNALMFDTKVTVLNNAWGHEIDHQYPVATLQLDGNCLFEIDQVENANSVPENEGALPSGIGMITVRVKNLAAIAEKFGQEPIKVNTNYYNGLSAILLTGPAGERIELIG